MPHSPGHSPAHCPRDGERRSRLVARWGAREEREKGEGTMSRHSGRGRQCSSCSGDGARERRRGRTGWSQGETEKRCGREVCAAAKLRTMGSQGTLICESRRRPSARRTPGRKRGVSAARGREGYHARINNLTASLAVPTKETEGQKRRLQPESPGGRPGGLAHRSRTRDRREEER